MYCNMFYIQDGYTKEVSGPDSVRVLVATKAKPNKDVRSPLDREYFTSFLNVRLLFQYIAQTSFKIYNHTVLSWHMKKTKY